MATRAAPPKIRGKTRTLVGNWQEDRANEGEEVDIRRGHANLITRGEFHSPSEWCSVQQEAFRAVAMPRGRDDARPGLRAQLRQQQRLEKIRARREAEEQERMKKEEEELRKARLRRVEYGLKAEEEMKKRKEEEQKEELDIVMDQPITFYTDMLGVADVAHSAAVGANPWAKSTKFTKPAGEYLEGEIRE